MANPEAYANWIDEDHMKWLCSRSCCEQQDLLQTAGAKVPPEENAGLEQVKMDEPVGFSSDLPPR